MVRHLAHLTRTFEKDLLELLRVRQETWGELGEGAPSDPRVGELSATGADTEAALMPECQPCAALPRFGPATLEYCLADKRLILPGEDEQLYETLARQLWAIFRPANMLEEFVTCDVIQGQWRLDRVLRIEGVLFERFAVSGTGDNCGHGFAFVNDSQQNQALESLRSYEAVLRKRFEKRMALWRKLRKAGLADASLPKTQPPAASPQPNTPTSMSSSGHLASTSRPSPVAQSAAPPSPQDGSTGT